MCKIADSSRDGYYKWLNRKPSRYHNEQAELEEEHNWTLGYLAMTTQLSFENRLKEFTPLGVGLSGSGPTYFAVFESRFKAKQCEKALKKEKITAFTVKPIKKSVFFE